MIFMFMVSLATVIYVAPYIWYVYCVDHTPIQCDMMSQSNGSERLLSLFIVFFHIELCRFGMNGGTVFWIILRIERKIISIQINASNCI